MSKSVSVGIVGVVGVILLYCLVWPVPVEPVSWQSPRNPGYTGPFAPNDRLRGMEFLSIGSNHGPEAVALDSGGRIYAATAGGYIVRLQPDGTRPENWVHTQGRPLGISFDRKGNLIVADAFRGLLMIGPDKTVTELATVAEGVPVTLADDVDVGADGKIYFSDATTKFAPKKFGAMHGILLDILEHGGHGRLLVYDPAIGKTHVLLKGLNFANGVAVGHDQTYVLVSETGSYRVIRYWIAGPKKGKAEPFIEGLPSFPDNVSAGLGGRYWVALVSPRNKLVDKLSDRPFLRKVIQRLPEFVRPKAASYGHIIAINGEGKVVEDLQDPNTTYPQNTSVTETTDYLYVGSLVAPVLGRLPKQKNRPPK